MNEKLTPEAEKAVEEAMRKQMPPQIMPEDNFQYLIPAKIIIGMNKEMSKLQINFTYLGGGVEEFDLEPMTEGQYLTIGLPGVVLNKANGERVINQIKSDTAAMALAYQKQQQEAANGDKADGDSTQKASVTKINDAADAKEADKPVH